MATVRMNDEQYTQAIAELKDVSELNNLVLVRLGELLDECDRRGLEQIAGKRSNRGKSSSQSRKVIALVNGLSDRFDCWLRRRDYGEAFRICPKGARW